ncbi:MAG: alpha/beta hydrolase, partial [Ginsengibacter sp.]
NVVSGNFISTYDWVPRYIERSKKYLDKGFTVFLVIHGSQPRYAIPDEISDVKRSVRFIRYHAADYGIDPNKLGITGSSAGGNLALIIGLSDDKPSDSKDPVDHVSARVQAVGVFYPPTDFLNYGMNNISPLQSDMMLRKQGVAAAFDFKEWNDSTKTYTSITIPEKRLEIAKEISPAYYVTSDDPPVYIIHGDADIVVPIQQSKLLIKKLEEVKVPNHLMIVKGKGHGWKDQGIEEENLVNWFEKWLK